MQWLRLSARPASESCAACVEAFAGGGRAVASTRDYPGEDETSVRLWSDRSSVVLSRVEAWSMGCGWEDDRAVDDQEWPVS